MYTVSSHITNKTWHSWIRPSWHNYENNKKDAQYRLIYYSKSALHVSGDVFAHHQENLTVFAVSGSVHPSCCWLPARSNLSEYYEETIIFVVYMKVWIPINLALNKSDTHHILDSVVSSINVGTLTETKNKCLHRKSVTLRNVSSASTKFQTPQVKGH
jgi:hypothetical protein